MITKLKVGSAISAALMLCASFVTQAVAEDCHRGTLDEAYCDRNLDQVADLPLDPKDWVDPKTLIFTYTPVEDPAVYANVWKPFTDHLEKMIDRATIIFLTNRGAPSPIKLTASS